MRRAALRRANAGAAGLWLAAALSGCHPMAGRPQSPSEHVDALVARCTEAMAREVCVAQRDDEVQASRPAASAAPVFVAGTGVVDSQAYAEIREAGQAMCSLVKARCGSDWQGPACRTARSLWPSPAPS